MKMWRFGKEEGRPTRRYLLILRVKFQK